MKPRTLNTLCRRTLCRRTLCRRMLSAGALRFRSPGQGHDVEPKLFESPDGGEVFIQVRGLGDVACNLMLVSAFNIGRVVATRKHDDGDVHQILVSLDRC